MTSAQTLEQVCFSWTSGCSRSRERTRVHEAGKPPAKNTWRHNNQWMGLEWPPSLTLATFESIFDSLCLKQTKLSLCRCSATCSSNLEKQSSKNYFKWLLFAPDVSAFSTYSRRNFVLSYSLFFGDSQTLLVFNISSSLDFAILVDFFSTFFSTFFSFSHIVASSNSSPSFSTEVDGSVTSFWPSFVEHDFCSFGFRKLSWISEHGRSSFWTNLKASAWNTREINNQSHTFQITGTFRRKELEDASSSPYFRRFFRVLRRKCVWKQWKRWVDSNATRHRTSASTRDIRLRRKWTRLLRS